MTANWFEVKVKYLKTNEDGREKKITEAYLLDAMSYTEAESRTMHEMESIISGEYQISSLKKSNITEIVNSEDENDDRWYKSKVLIIDAEEVSGKEKASAQYYLVAASDIRTAMDNLEKALSTYVVPYEISSITDTLFMDVFPYFTDEENTEIPENLKPLNEMEIEYPNKQMRKQYFLLKSHTRKGSFAKGAFYVWFVWMYVYSLFMTLFNYLKLFRNYFELNFNFNFTMKFNYSCISSNFFNFFKHDFLSINTKSCSL